MPWFLIALIAVVAIVGLLALLPKPEIENARASNLGDFQFPRAQEGDPMPLIYGRVKLKSPNVLWYGDFEAVPITEKVKTGLFSSKRITTGYKYYIGMALGLCIGPDVTLHRIWAGKDEMWTGTVNGDGASVTFAADELFGGEKKGGGVSGACSFYSGANTQTVDSYLATHTDGADTTMMPMMCWLSAQKVYVGTSANMRAWFMEMSRYSNGLGLTGGMERIGDDMNGVEILFDIMTNKFARRGLSAALIDTATWIAAAETVYAEGNGTSMKVEASNSAGDVVVEILRQIDGIMYQDPATGRIILKLIREDYDELTLPVLGVAEVEDVTNFTKTLWEDTVNQVRVTYIDRDQDFTNRPVIEQDMANINFQQSVRSTEIKFPGVYSADQAQTLCRRELSAISVPMFKCEVKANRKAANLKPGQAFKLTWPALNLDETIMRVQKYNLGTLKDGRITFTAVQDKFGSLSSNFTVPPSTGWTPVVDNPSNVLNARLWRAPFWFAQQLGATLRTTPYVFAFAENPGAPTLQYDVKAEQDSISSDALLDSLFNEVGVLDAAMPANTTTIASLAVSSILEAAGTVTDADIRNGINLALIDDELVGFLTGTVSALTTVYRGLLGTTAAAHSIGADIYFLGDHDGLITEPFQESLLITAEYLAETATKSEALGAGVTVTYTPPADVNCDAEVDNIAVTNEVGGIIPQSVETISWTSSARTDADILLPGDSTPAAPFGTEYVVEIYYSAAVQHTAVVSTLSYDFDFSTVGLGVALEVRVSPRTSGNLGATANNPYTIGTPPVSSRYWRVLVTNQHGDVSGRFSASEIELYATIGGADETIPALAGTNASAKSTFSGSAAANAFDDSHSSGTWFICNGSVYGGGGEWIAWDFGVGNSFVITEVGLRAIHTQLGLCIEDFELQWSTDGVTYVTSIAVAGIPAWSANELRKYS